jgi:hypothetical protein
MSIPPLLVQNREYIFKCLDDREVGDRNLRRALDDTYICHTVIAKDPHHSHRIAEIVLVDGDAEIRPLLLDRVESVLWRGDVVLIAATRSSFGDAFAMQLVAQVYSDENPTNNNIFPFPPPRHP